MTIYGFHVQVKDIVDLTTQLARADKAIDMTRKRIKDLEMNIAEAQPSEKCDDKTIEKVSFRSFFSPNHQCMMIVCAFMQCWRLQLDKLRHCLGEKLATFVKELEAQLHARERLLILMA